MIKTMQALIVRLNAAEITVTRPVYFDCAGVLRLKASTDTIEMLESIGIRTRA